MGSVINEIICPKCEYKEAQEDFYYKTGAFYIFCPRCGYSHTHTYKTGKNGDVILKRTKKRYGTLIWVEKISGGKGIIELRHVKGATLISVSSQKQLKKILKKALEYNMQRYKVNGISYTFKRDGKWFIKDVLKKREYSWTKKEIMEKLIYS